MNETCGCCDGIQILTPRDIANRPGLAALSYRVGTQASFLETMKTRLSNLYLDIPTNEDDEQGRPKTQRLYPLRGLTTRAADDFAIAMLDAWATLADVLTFYQERIANEGYLRTATERRSILELARLVGYRLRPGVAASVYLAYLLEKNHDVIILPGNRAQSVPGPGELPQSFETAEKLEARFAWNALLPRLTRPQYITLVPAKEGTPANIQTQTPDGAIYFQGAATGLKLGDPLLFVFYDGKGDQVFSRVKIIDTQAADNRTKVTLDLPDLPPPTAGKDHAGVQAQAELKSRFAEGEFRRLVRDLSKPPLPQPRNAQRLARSVAATFAQKSDIHQQLLINLNRALAPTLYSAIANTVTQPPFSTPPLPAQGAQTLRVKAAPFGHNLPLLSPNEIVSAEIDVGKADKALLALDAEYKDIVNGSWVVIERKDGTKTAYKIKKVLTLTLGGSPSTTDYNFYSTQGSTVTDTKTTTSSTDGDKKTTETRETTTTSHPVRIKVTVLELETEWLTDADLKADPALVLRTTTIYAQSEPRDLAEEPIAEDIGGNATPDTIELAQLYDGLQSGRWAVISGERADVVATNGEQASGVMASELIMLKSVTQEVRHVQVDKDGTPEMIPLPGDTPHTFVHLAKPLAYRFKRASVTIAGNVVRATHGETRIEVLGSGDGSKTLQQFALRQSPLTFISAPTPAGAASTLQVRVNDLLWHEADSLAGLGATDRRFTTKTDDADKTTVIFGNGQHGARPPTGIENVKAVYRTGIGKPGNVQPGQISLLSTKPLGVKGVNNPLRASGGADKENRDQARRNVPVALLALDRLVSLQDYADFARTYAGIGKAAAARLSDGRRQLVHLTIAGAENIPIDPTSDLYRNLFQALHQFGDPHEPLQVKVAEVLFLVISAKVRLQPDYLWEAVEQKIRATLLDIFSFDRRDLGQLVFQSEVFSAIQSVTGVEQVDLEILDAIDQDRVITTLDASPKDDPNNPLLSLKLGNSDVVVSLAQPSKKGDPDQARTILPAQLAFLTTDIPDTLILTELAS